MNGINLNAAEKIGVGPAIKQLGTNTAQILRNSGSHMLQDHASLKTNSLVFSSLALVISRILIANFSAFKTKGTPDGPYRHREAIRTDIREVCGWTFGFVVLRWFQTMTKNVVKAMYGIKDGVADIAPIRIYKRIANRFFGKNHTIYKKEGGMFHQLGQAIKASVSGRKLEVKPLPLDPAEKVSFVFNQQRFSHLEKILRKVPFLAEKSSEALMKDVYHWAPILLGSIPAVLLAGYLLERFTRDHSKDVVDFVASHTRHGQDAADPNAQPGQPQPQVQPTAAAQRFDSYVSRIQQKQQQRMQG